MPDAKGRLSFSDAVATITLFATSASALKLSYEWGYSSALSIPFELVAPHALLDTYGLQFALPAAAAITIAGGFAHRILNLLPPPLRMRFWILAPFAVCATSILFLYGKHWQFGVRAGAFLIGLGIAEFVLPLISQAHRRGFIMKLAAEDTVSLLQRDELAQLREFFSPIWRRLLALLAVGVYSSYHWGFAGALNQSMFLIDSKRPEQIVLRALGGKLICAPIDWHKNLIGPGIEIRDLDAAGVLTYKRIDWLRR